MPALQPTPASPNLHSQVDTMRNNLQGQLLHLALTRCCGVEPCTHDALV